MKTLNSLMTRLSRLVIGLGLITIPISVSWAQQIPPGNVLVPVEITYNAHGVQVIRLPDGKEILFETLWSYYEDYVGCPQCHKLALRANGGAGPKINQTYRLHVPTRLLGGQYVLPDNVTAPGSNRRIAYEAPSQPEVVLPDTTDRDQDVDAIGVAHAAASISDAGGFLPEWAGLPIALLLGLVLLYRSNGIGFVRFVR